MIVLLLIVPVSGSAQARDTIPTRLTPVEVRVTRDAARSPLDVPFAVSILRPDSMRPGQRHLALDETLFLLPGVTVANRHNPTQDPRIAIRGFGSRAAFGVRGVRVLRDGMPLTLPDGQTPTDYLDLEAVGVIEVIRGVASALYGNAAGGVIDIRSSEPPAERIVAELRGWAGTFGDGRDGKGHGLRRWVGVAGGTAGVLRYQGNVSHTESDGYREYSRQRATSGYARAQAELGHTNVAVQLMALHMPLAENPGALTRAELDISPRQAHAFQMMKRTRKEVHQWQVGLSATRPMAGGELSTIVYTGGRNLYNPLTFAVVDIDRGIYGVSVRGSQPFELLGATHRMTVGADAQWLIDDRRNFSNCNPVPGSIAICPMPGVERGVVTLDQREQVTGVGPFISMELAVADRYRLSMGARFDNVTFSVEDRLVGGANPDDSGERTMRAFSPMVGAVVRLGLLQALYANVSSAFETPTTTELGNRPDSVGGINRDLDPQYATTTELGIKGFALSRLRYDVAAFDTRVRDELIGYEVPDGNGRRYFRNAGRTHRRGVEVGLATVLGPFEFGAAYTYSNFEFADYPVDTVPNPNVTMLANYAGSRIPAIPVQRLEASTTWRWRGTFATVEALVQGGVYVDDANRTRVAGYEVLNLRLGGTAVFSRLWLSTVVSMQNVFNRSYVSSIVVNALAPEGAPASQARYYEPAPGRTIFAGLTIGVK